MRAQTPTGIKLDKTARTLAIQYGDGQSLLLPLEYLRVFSPSAEVRGHGLEEPLLVPGKRNINVTQVVPVGRYAVRLVFDDGHNTGLYSWDVLWELAQAQDQNWERYLARLAEHGMSRDSSLVKLTALGPKKYKPAAN